MKKYKIVHKHSYQIGKRVYWVYKRSPFFFWWTLDFHLSLPAAEKIIENDRKKEMPFDSTRYYD